MNMSSIPPTAQNTSVTVMVSSTANDQLSQFNVSFNSLTLTSQSGKMVNLFTTPQKAEFVHLNGTAEPLITVSIPQDVYTAASASIQSPQVTCVMLQPTGGLLTDEFQSGSTPTATVSVPSPITVTGTAMGLLLNLQLSQSAKPSNCPLTSSNPSITGTFTLAPVTLTFPPTNVQNGKMTSLIGQISSIDATKNSFIVAAADGPTWSVQSSNSTVYQGAAAFSTLVAGMPVDIDVSIQPDGSLLASRVAAQDANPTDVSVVSGPLLFVASSEPALYTFPRGEQGFLFAPGATGGPFAFSFGSPAYQISGQFTNLPSLPFAPMLNAATIFAGQNVSVSAHALNFAGGPTYVPATTITLMPQTINGTVTSVGSEGSFTTYAVSLAAYDLIPALAVQPGQTTATTNPSSVVVYVDSNTLQLNTKQVAVGNVFRFNGLLFNDSGTLRLDCAEINDGVPE
ncbi:MAG TPA: DUF5666 domain-containing protein [Candidatus Acidoferrum sp.]